MKRTLMKGFVAGLMSLATFSFAGTPQQSQDTMKGDGMKSGGMSQDAMSQDKMSHEMPQTKALKGWVSDSECAARGKKKCTNKEHIAQGAKLVLVTDGDNKIWTITNPETLAEHQGHRVQVKATTDTEKGTITVQEVKMLKRGK